MHTDRQVADWVARLGEQFAVFDQQDSGCVSYGIAVRDGRRLFVKTSTTPAAAGSMRRGMHFHTAAQHPALVAPLSAHDFPDGNIAAVYPWHDGRVLYPTTSLGSRARTDPAGAMATFRALPTARVMDALDRILDAHDAVSAAGFVAVDFYDGSLLYDFDQHIMRLVDLDEYRPGPFTLTDERLPGSTRFMAPEELQRGATIDERTTVYVLGRTLRLLLDAGDSEERWRGSDRQLDVIARATQARPDDRFQTTVALSTAWRTA